MFRLIVSIDKFNNTFWKEIFLSPFLYKIIGSAFYFAKRRKVKVLEGIDPKLKDGFNHNFKYREENLQDRPNKCFRIIRAHNLNLSKSKLLIIGPRNFSELLLAFFHGFKWKNIFGLDLYSEHPKVRLANIENVQNYSYEHDVIVCSGVLNYVDKLSLAMKNLIKLSKNGGLVVIQTDLNEKLDKDINYNLSGNLNIDEKIKLVEENIDMITFREDIKSIYKGNLHQYLAFKVKK